MIHVDRTVSHLLVLLLATFASECVGQMEDIQRPDWISGPRQPGNPFGPRTSEIGQGEEPFRVSREFQLDRGVQLARLRFAGDYCRSSVWINGQGWLQVDPYCSTQDLDVTTAFRRGVNRIDVVLDQRCGPTAIALSVDIKLTTGARLSVTSDSNWQITGVGKVAFVDNGVSAVSRPTLSSAVNLGPVRPELWGTGRRTIAVSAFENYEQWQQSLDGKSTGRPPRLEAAKGFEISLVRSAEKNEGSWVSMAFDSKGRLVIAREDQGFLRLTLGDSFRSVNRVQHIPSDLAECRGLVFHDEMLYANANNSKGMYRLRFSEAGSCEDVTLLRKFEGGVGHGRNDLTITPDGKLLSIHGDSVDPPRESVSDRTPPVRTPRGSKSLPAGYVVKTDPEGQSWELVCTGLRNPFGIATLPNGDAFTYDADNEFDMGMPWYRPTRFVQLVSGADYGYRSMSGQLPGRFPDQPDFAPYTLHIGRGSPTAIMYGGRLSFPPPYDRAMYILDWTYGRVVAIHLVPHGVGYRAAAELFAQGRPLNVTDLATGPDGAMYVITGGRKTQSALYRIGAIETTAPSGGSVEQSRPTSAHEVESNSFAEKRRTVKSTLESFHGQPDPTAIEVAWEYLADPDPLIRAAARTCVEKQPIGQWKLRPSNPVSSDPVSNWHQMSVLLSRSRLADWESAGEILDRLATIDPNKLTLADRFVYLRILDLCEEASPRVALDRRSQFGPVLLRLASGSSAFRKRVTPVGTSDDLRRRLGLALGTWHPQPSLNWILDELVESESQEDRLAGLAALRDNLAGVSADQQRRYFEALNATSDLIGGQGMPGFRDLLRKDALSRLNDDQKHALGKLINDTPLADSPLPPSRPIVRQWTMEDLASLARTEELQGNVGQGKQIFQDALCGRCHRAGLRGPAVGPDLTHVARRFSRRDILESILKPSLSVAENYRLAVVEMATGEVHTGRVVAEGDYRSQILKVNTNALRPGEYLELDKRQMTDFRLIETSPMPEGLLNSFTLDQIRDLLAYLEAD